MMIDWIQFMRAGKEFKIVPIIFLEKLVALLTEWALQGETGVQFYAQ